MINSERASANTPLRILQAGSTAYRGGVANAIKGLCSGLRDMGHEVALIADGGDLSGLVARGVDCHTMDLRQLPGPLLRSTLAYREILRRFRPHVVHVHGRSAALRCKLAGRSADWFTLHSTHLTRKEGSYDAGPIRRYLSPFGRSFFVLDDLASDYLQESFAVDPGAIVKIGNGVDCDRFRVPTAFEREAARREFGAGPGETLVMFVGRMETIKQPGALIAAARRALAEGRTDLRFALVGDGELRASLAEEIEASGVGGICVMYPWMDVLAAYFAADLVVMPSQYEGFGLVAAEAMATGCPVLRTRTGGTDQMIREGITGFACDTAPDAVVEALFAAVERPERLAAMRGDARRWAVSHLDLRCQVEQIVAQYRQRLRAS